MTEREFEQVMRRYEKLVYTVCRQLVNDPATAEDLTQETFLSVWSHVDTCPQNEDSRRAWICRIAVNKAKDHLKSAYHRRTTASEAPGETSAALAEALTARSLADDVEARLGAQTVRRHIGGLAEPYRTVCALYFLHDWDAESIAAKLARPVKTVHTQLYRAKKALRQELVCAS